MPHTRVLLLTDSDVFAGTERHMLELALALGPVGVAARVACPVPGALADRATAAGLDVVPVAKRGPLDWRAVAAVRREVRSGRADLVHAHNSRTALLAAAAVRAAGRGRCVLTQHFLELGYATRPGPAGVAARAVHRWVNRHTDHVIAISQAVRAGVLARGEATADRVTVVPNGIAPPDVAALRPAAAVRAEFGLAADAPLVVCAARLQPEKDVATLVAAMAAVRADVPGAACVVAGEGPLQADLTAQIDRLGLAGVVRLAGFRADVLSLVAAADVFALPSPVEPFGLVLLEAMALSRPVVATAAGGPLEIVADGHTGLLVPPGDPAALADAVARLLSDAALRSRMGDGGLDRYRQAFTADRMAPATADVYRRAGSDSAT